MLQLRPTFSESWYRVANLKPRLRGGAQISRQYYRGERWYVVRDPAGNQYHRLSDPAYRFVGLLDGRRTIEEAWDLVGGQLADDAPTQPEVIQILSQLYAANLIETDITPDATVLLRRHKDQVKRKMQNRLMNVLFPRVPLWDPDRFLKRWMPVARIVLSWFGALVWLIVVCSAIAILIPRWDSGPETLKEAAKSAIDPSNWLFMWACFVGIKAIHELGHAFSCRRFGGECHELGLMLLVFIPTPYVDASSAWTFPSKWQRAFVGAAGMIVELFVASIMAFIWANTTPHQLIHQLAYNCMFIASVSTILFNANPLLRYDGYYILSDLLEIPNLRQKSVEYSLGIIKRHIFRIKLQQPLPPVGQRVWLLLYSIASGLYRIFIGVMIVVIVAFKVPILGVLMAIGGIVTWAGVPLYQVTKYLALEPELHRKRGRAIFFCSSVAACLVVLIGFVPFRVYVRAQGILEAADHQTINAPYPGFVEMTANNGQWLKKGDIILKADNPNLDEEIASYRADLERDIATEQAALGSSDMATYQEAVADFQATNATLQKDLKYQNDLTIRATIDGQLVAPDIHQLIGSYLQVGKTQIGTVVAPGDLQADCVVDINDASLARRWKLTASQVEVRPVSDFSTKLPVKRIDPFPSETTDINPLLGTQGGGNVEMVQQDGSPIVGPVDPSEKIRARVMQSIIRLTLANPDDEFLPGQRVYVRVTLEKEPLIWQWSRWFMQLIQQHDTGKWI